MKTILIVEDNDKNMKLARDVLQAKGYATLEATTAGEAVSQTLTHRPDLVLMDIQLPDFDGVEALRRIRAEPGARHTPVVAFTASVTTADRSRIEDAGFDAFLAKPIRLREFLDTIVRLLAEGAS
ncbi:MAG: response regulator [Rubrivivax sp.]